MQDNRKAKVITGAKSILETREYKVISENYNSEEGVFDMIGEKPGKPPKKKERMIVRIPDEDPIGVTTLRAFRDYRTENGFDHAILLALTKYTHYTKREAEENKIEIFSIKFPFFDLFQHNLVPKHEFATPEENSALTAKYSIDLKQLPKILVTDPAAQLLGAKIGDVIKITRDSPTAGRYVVFRYCVE